MVFHVDEFDFSWDLEIPIGLDNFIHVIIGYRLLQLELVFVTFDHEIKYEFLKEARCERLKYV